ncbi:hypothetical protein [Terrabacter sp. Ter38]|uniref:hypothetical protein n=1 Tax=Terrabacter sp. Ter38 TaxID=2926030 RepID=UPI0021194F84|nr:hypothetical protein [Terrabacter sp. Ter38]
MATYSIDTALSGSVNSDVMADVTSQLAGLDDMKLTLAGDNTVHTDSSVALAPVTTTSTVDSTAKLDSTSTLDTASKIDSAAVVDLRPVAVDSCVRLELAPPPATEVSTPYEQQWSWSVLGLEVFGVTVRGRTSTHVRPVPGGPVVIDL